MTIYEVFMVYFIYGFLGWCVEVVYQATAKGLVVNRGFLNGPICPIYGFGVVALFLAGDMVTGSSIETWTLPKTFIAGVVIATAIELFGGWALDKLFHMRWWDYSQKPLNLHGYICLEFSIIWGVGIAFVVKMVQPMLKYQVGKLIPHDIGWVLIAIVCIVHFVDFCVSVSVVMGLSKRISELEELQKSMRIVSDELSTRLGTSALETSQNMAEIRVQAELGRAELKQNLEVKRAEFTEELEAKRAELTEELESKRAEISENLESKRAEATAAYEARMEQLEQRKAEVLERLAHTRHFGAGRMLRSIAEAEYNRYWETMKELKERLGA